MGCACCGAGAAYAVDLEKVEVKVVEKKSKKEMMREMMKDIAKEKAKRDGGKKKMVKKKGGAGGADPGGAATTLSGAWLEPEEIDVIKERVFELLACTEDGLAEEVFQAIAEEQAQHQPQPQPPSIS